MNPVMMHDGAAADLRDGFPDYEGQRNGLGGQLRTAFESALGRIPENPRAYANEDDQGNRFCPLHRIVYSIVY